MKRYTEMALSEPALVALGSTDTPHPANRIATMQAELRMPDGTTRGPFGIIEFRSEIQKAFDEYPDSNCIEMRVVPNA
jgi:hypothetical protein